MDFPPDGNCIAPGVAYSCQKEYSLTTSVIVICVGVRCNTMIDLNSIQTLLDKDVSSTSMITQWYDANILIAQNPFNYLISASMIPHSLALFSMNISVVQIRIGIFIKQVDSSHRSLG